MKKTFLPSIKVDSGPVAQSSDEDLLFNLIRDSDQQGRPQMKRHPLLDRAAYVKAKDMAEKNYFSHNSPEGKTPNEVVREAGFRLPDYYPQKGNNVESLSIGGNNPQDTLAGWFGSPHHREHVFGQNDFYRGHDCVGIGKATAQDGRNLYVFFSAPCA